MRWLSLWEVYWYEPIPHCSCSLMAMKLCDLIVSEKTKVVHFSCDIKNTAHVLYAKADSVVLYSHTHSNEHSLHILSRSCLQLSSREACGLPINCRLRHFIANHGGFIIILTARDRH